MNEELERVLRLCEQTPSWTDIEIDDLEKTNHLGDTPLHTVCGWGQLEPVQILVEAGADVNARGDIGFTPLFNAVIGKNVQVIEYLLHAGANPRIKNEYNDLVVNFARSIKAPREIIKVLEDASRPRS